MLCAVRRFGLFIKYWLPPLLWMSLIFFGSADSASVSHSSRIIGPLVRWLFPALSENGVDTCVLVARKCAHLTEYGLFAMLLWRAIRQPVARDTRPWKWREAGLALIIVVCYASTDEIHQLFVPGRGPSVHDVLIDTLGGTLGLLLLWALGRRTKRW